MITAIAGTFSDHIEITLRSNDHDTEGPTNDSHDHD